MSNERRRLPIERESITHRFVIRSQDEEVKAYLTVGLYADGTPGEIFTKMDRQGSLTSGFLDSWSIAVSLLLQTGMPLESIADKFIGMSFHPSGMTDNPEIRIAKSPIDYIARYLKARFVKSAEAAA